MSDRLKLPPTRDFAFYQRRKHDKWREVAAPAPPLEAPVADSHAHIHMLPDPAWELARAAANNVDFICAITDPSEDGPQLFDNLAAWQASALENAPILSKNARCACRADVPSAVDVEQGGASSGKTENLNNEDAENALVTGPFDMHSERYLTNNPRLITQTAVRIAVGVHPHNAKLYTPEIEAELLARLQDPRVVALGEIGLDYHYDLSPRETQCKIFRRQIRLAQQRNLPLVLHLRGGEDPEADNAHREAYRILQEEDALGPATLLHCCALPPDELSPWVEADCYIAYGGALTFKNAEAAREGALLVPENRLLLETDSPYMAPEPMRGTACTPAHVIFTAAALAALRGHASGPSRERFLTQLHANTLRFYRVNAA